MCCHQHMLFTLQHMWDVVYQWWDLCLRLSYTAVSSERFSAWLKTLPYSSKYLFLFRALRIKKPTLFLLNVCICLLVVNIIFLSSAGNVGNRIECYVSTAFLHYFLLATWFWMSSNAYDIYNALVKAGTKIKMVIAVLKLLQK